MEFKFDTRNLLLPLIHLLFPSPHFTNIILTIILLFVSIKVVVPLQQPVSFLFCFRAIDPSISVMACFLCLISLSKQHFWIVNPILILLSHWDDWLYKNFKSIPKLQFLCIFNGWPEEAAQLDWQQAVNNHFVV